MSINTIALGVYCCAHDLRSAPLGNHHMLLLVASLQRLEQLTLTPESENGVDFTTLAAYIGAGHTLFFVMNQDDDILSVREYIDPDEQTSTLRPDLEFHRVSPPNGDEAKFIAEVARLALNYHRNTKSNAPRYNLLDKNCSAWVNTLLACAAVPKSERETLGEFFGFDWGEENEIDSSYFGD